MSPVRIRLPPPTPFSGVRLQDLFLGDIAQLVERLNGIEKVRGPTPLISTPSLPLPRQTTEATKVSPSHNTPCLTLEVNFLLTLRGYYGRRGNVRKKTELVSPRTCPTEECGRFSKFSPTPFQVTFKCTLSRIGENFESTALGVECVLRKVRDERHHAATRFRNTLQNPSVADCDFSPVGNEKPLEAQPGEWAKNRTIGHVFGGGSGLVSVWLDLLSLP